MEMDKPDLYAGGQYGLYGLITKAWRNPDFLQQTLKAVEGSNGWQFEIF